MSGFRDLQAKLQKIEENYFKDLDIDIQELRRANKDLSADQLVRLARDRFGQEAATYLSNQLEAEYDLADYNASDPQPHLDDMIDNAFADDPYDLDYDKYIKKGIDEDEDNWKCSTCGGASQLNNGGDESCHECKGYDYDISNLNNDEDEFNHGGPDPMCDNCAGEGTIDLGKKTYNCPECNSGAIDEGMFGEETYAEMVEYWKGSLSRSIVTKKVFTQLYRAANNDIDELNAAIEEEAHSIAETYHGSGEGIGTSDVNHFVASIGSSLGIDDLFGWRKPKVEEEFEHYGSGANFIPVILNGKDVGVVWKEGEGDWHAEYSKTGASWGMIDSQQEAVELIQDEASEDIDESKEDKWLGPYEDVGTWEGQTIKITGGEYAGETGKVINVEYYHSDLGYNKADFTVRIHSGGTVTLYPGEHADDQFELLYDPTHRPDGRYNPELEEDSIDEARGQ